MSRLPVPYTSILRRPARRRPSILAVGGAVVWLATIGGCGRAAADAPRAAVDDAVPVLAAEVRADDVVDVITATGTTAGLEEVPLAFTIGGIVARVTPRAGDRVAAGAVLAELQRTEVGAQLATADEAIAKAARDLARVERLHRDSVATLVQLQDARTALAVARNAGAAARFAADNAVIRAPGAGLVLARHAEPGQVVDAGTPILVVRRAGSGMIVRAALADRDALRVAPGDSAEVRLEAMPDRRFAGHVLRRAGAAGAATGTYDVEIALGADADSLPSGLVAQVALTPRRRGARTVARPVVPVEALVDADGDSAAVFVLRADGRTVERRTIRLADVAAALTGARLPVVDGLRTGERVIVGNTVRLADGARVAVASNVPAASADAPRWQAVR